jgi:hypothetical protein
MQRIVIELIWRIFDRLCRALVRIPSTTTNRSMPFLDVNRPNVIRFKIICSRSLKTVRIESDEVKSKIPTTIWPILLLILWRIFTISIRQLLNPNLDLFYLSFEWSNHITYNNTQLWVRLSVCPFALLFQNQCACPFKNTEDQTLLYSRSLSSFEYVTNKEVVSAMTGKNHCGFAQQT